jgi:hypothetical protein
MGYQFFGELPGFGPGACSDPNAVTRSGQFGGCFCNTGYICSQTEDPTWGCTGTCLSMTEACADAGAVWDPVAQICAVTPKNSQQAALATPEECAASGFNFDPVTGQCILRDITQAIDDCQQAGNTWDANSGTCITPGGQVIPSPGGGGRPVVVQPPGQDQPTASKAGMTEGQKTAAIVAGSLGLLLLVAALKS